MKKLTDQELDSLFKEASEGYQPAFDGVAWDAMVEKLNKPKPKQWRKWLLFSLLGLLIFSGGVWVGRTSGNMTQALTIDTGQLDVEISAAQGTIQELDKTKQTEEPSVEKTQIASDRSDLEIDNSNATEPNSQIHHPGTLTVSKENEGIEDTKWIAIVDTNDQQEIFRQTEKVQLQTDSVFPVGIVTDSVTLSKELENKQGSRSIDGLFIRLLASPDLSSVKFGPTELGSNIGIVGEYAFASRFSVSTGIIRSRKNYESYQEVDYSSDVRHLQGSCNILDVPLNLTYYFPSQHKISAYITVGASSYLMLREDYIYTVKSNTGDRVYPYQAIRKNNEWLKVLNLAAGMQYKFALRWQVQVEPFVKAPLADLGERNVRLSSFGAFAAIRYRINSEYKNP